MCAYYGNETHVPSHTHCGSTYIDHNVTNWAYLSLSLHSSQASSRTCNLRSTSTWYHYGACNILSVNALSPSHRVVPSTVVRDNSFDLWLSRPINHMHLSRRRKNKLHCLFFIKRPSAWCLEYRNACIFLEY